MGGIEDCEVRLEEQRPSGVEAYDMDLGVGKEGDIEPCCALNRKLS